MIDIQSRDLPGLLGEVPHRYGPGVHVLSNPWAASLLAVACSPETVQPHFNRLVGRLYDLLLGAVVGLELPRTLVRVPTRMTLRHPDVALETEVVDPQVRVVVAGVARAGTLPAHHVQASLCEVLPPSRVRVDHLYMNRRANERGEVVGIDFAGSKIGGPVAGAHLLVPDPMGATGHSMDFALRHYRESGRGEPARVVAMHLVVTPEYVRHMARTHPEVQIYALRLDRGLSAPAVLSRTPGERPDEERGLDEHQYIVPGAGGVGEVMNNSD